MRVVNLIAASLLGLVLLAGGLLLAAETALVAAGQTPWLVPLDRWHARLSHTPLHSGWILGISIGVAVIGLIVLALQLRRWAPPRVLTGDARGAWWVTRRSVEQRAAAAAAAVRGVHDARADVRGSERRWRLRLRAVGHPEQRDEVARAVRRELDRLAVPKDLAVNLALRRPRRVV
jgi:hypothetical protein